MKVKLSLFKAGYCRQLESLIIRGGRPRIVSIPVIFALIEHPVAGYILVDTGYAAPFFKATRAFPYKLYDLTTPASLPPGQSAAEQLAKLGIAATDIAFIFISHFHGDHIAGLTDFPAARFWCTAEAYTSIHNKTGFAALKRGFLPDLLAADFATRVSYLPAPIPRGGLEPFEQATDVLGDGSLIALDLPGHAVGQQGLLLQTKRGSYLLAADACWYSASYRENRLPARLAQLIMDDPVAYKTSLDKLHSFHRLHPEVHIIPSHCPEIVEHYVATPL